MRRGTKVIGKNILSLADARHVASVKDLVIGPRQQDIAALLVDEGGLLRTSQVVPIDGVHSFGRDAVVIADSSAVVPASAVPKIAEIIDSDDKLLGKKVFSESGVEHGAVSDLFFDETNGRIVGLELSRGVVGDAARGRPYLDVEQIERIGPDVIFVRDVAGDGLERQVGGVQGGLQEAAGAAKDAVGGAAAKAGDAKPEDRLVGRRAGSDVEDEDGRLIVASGQAVTPDHVSRAREAGRLKQLTTSVGEWEARQASEGAGDAVEATADKAGSLWDQFTTRISEMTDATGRRVDEERTKKRLADIEDAIGRPVTKVILDREDNVVLDLGEVITHAAVQRAHDAGALDALLASVYRGEIELTKDEMRVGQPGSAAVERATGQAAIVDELEEKVRSAEEERTRSQAEKQQKSDAERAEREQERRERAETREQRRSERERDRRGAEVEAGR